MEKEYNFKRGEKGQFLPSQKREGLLATKSMRYSWPIINLGMVPVALEVILI